MTQDPQTWHYGLLARWWAEFAHDGPEINYFQKQIQRFGDPALDVACGTGRLLLPFLRAGLDADGTDISADMLAYCHEAAEQEGFSPALYNQASHELDLPRTYKTICVCGSFGIGGSREQDIEALNRFYKYLQPGGALVIDNHLPYKDEYEWSYWLRKNSRDLHKTWPPPGERRRTADGDELQLTARIAAVDPLEQKLTREIRAELWRDGQCIQQEQYKLLEIRYFKNEMVMLLEQAGFTNISVMGGYTDNPATADDDIVVFIARK